MKRKIVLIVLLTGLLIFTGCSKTDTGKEVSEKSTELTTKSEIDISNMFSDRDKEVGYDEENSVKIKLLDSGSTCDSDTVQISENTVTIISEGTYVLSGTMTDGMVIVEVEDTEKVHLVLDGVNITSKDSAAIYVREADKVFLTTAKDSQNTLVNGGTYTAIDENNIDAVIFSKSDLTLNGSGTLEIQAEKGHGVVSKDDLVLTSGVYNIQAESHGLAGKDSVRIASGNYTITAGKDGIHAENQDDSNLGFVYLSDGTFDITSDGDSISSGSWLQADGGVYEIQAGGGSTNVQQTDTGWQFGPGNMEQNQEGAEDTVSMKGVKATENLVITGGKYSIDSADDGIHSNENVTMSEGEFTISSGDDGVHADAATMVSGGTVNITKSYEGIEGLSIGISGGEISVVASDDGLNAAGGNDNSGFAGPGGDQFAAEEGAYIEISGGVLKVNANGDGIDSNGDVTVSGGETYVSGPTNNGNGALDYNGNGKVTGGIFAAAGSAGMAENFGDSSIQGVIMVNGNTQESDTAVVLSGADGNEILSWTPGKEYSSVIVSCPEITTGQEYTLMTGSAITQITMDSIVYGSGGGMGAAPERGGNMGERPDGEKNMGERPQRGEDMNNPPDTL